MMGYQEALQKWAVKHAGESATNVRVELEIEEKGFCDTCAYEVPSVKVSYTLNGKARYHVFDDYTFGAFLEELVEAAQS